MDALRGEDADRGQSAPLGVALVFAIMIVSTTAVVALGAGAISETKGALDGQRTEKSMTELDSQASLVALGQSNVQRVDIAAANGQDYTVDGSAGQLTLSYENTSDGSTTTVFSVDMGKVEYNLSDGQSVAYQGGGVWRSNGRGQAVMVSPPEFHYRDATLTLPLVTINNSGSVEGRATISKNGSKRYFPNTSVNSDFRNPLENAKVKITVTSQYYRGWGQYFETRTEGEVSYDHPNDEVTLTLVTPLEATRITSASSSLSAGGTFVLQGAAKTICSPNKEYTNSYNSSGTSDDYCDQAPGNDGDIVYAGDVDISLGAGNADIEGDLTSGATVFAGSGGGKPDVVGNISYTDLCDPSESDCADRINPSSAGSVEQISGVETASSIDSVVDNRVTEVKSDNDNGVQNISSNQLDFSAAGSSDEATLGPGSYYLTEISMEDDETLLLNTTGGPVTLAVEDRILLKGGGSSGGNITVVGDGVAKVYVNGTHSAPHLKMKKNARITNNGDDAPQFRLYGRDNFTAEVGAGNANLAKYVGVIYAPPGTGGTGSVTVDGGVVYGGILTGTTVVDDGSIHYDKALKSEKVLTQADSVVKITYIHASVNRINVTG